ncbi:mitochondrial 39-S ribosomal protein L47 (MRP-L47)-domain-containing protein [Massariosphaeria phaeospora]|uniref:Large ribosomal subunit protein uL29m n=1 Tax=Massariosphaeria phaeospora TaxID=100035 RepID=A0A7C8MFZ3_9PLEO|nr:mitochondrial 39-S ribosomal protein L47 (MRP-L47)-domain-containing protein [Massariosphaeria phaeospora]
MRLFRHACRVQLSKHSPLPAASPPPPPPPHRLALAMAALSASRLVRPNLAMTPADAVFSFLTPAVYIPRNAPAARFSTSPALWQKQKKRRADNNRNRGVSAMRNTGLRPRQTLSVKPKDFNAADLPKPVEREEKVEGDPEHGLWDFFKSRKLLSTPQEEYSHGRAWTTSELRGRSWEDLHSLWWVCVKERNRLATEKIERARLKAGYGDVENEDRDKTVQETMKAILDTLSERHKAYLAAYELAKNDPDIDLERTGGAQYVERVYDDYDDAPDDESSDEQVDVRHEPLKKTVE